VPTKPNTRSEPTSVRLIGLDRLLTLLLFLSGLALYVSTLAPSVAGMFSDTLEFQLVGPTLAIAHETGYPLYTLLSWLASTIFPLADIAQRVNLFSALCAALTAGILYRVALLLTGRRIAALCGALVFGISSVWWSQAVIAEVYTLAGLLWALLLWLALTWQNRANGSGSVSSHPSSERLLVALCFALGLSLTHHRMSLLLFPSIGILVLWTQPELLWQVYRWPKLLLALLAPLGLYMYIPLRAPVMGSLDGRYSNTWSGFWNWVLATQYGDFLTGNPFDLSRDARFFVELFRSQFGWIALVLGLMGIVTLARRPRRLVLLVLAFVISVIFGILYRTADVEVFFLQALLLGSMLLSSGVGGLQDLLAKLTARRSSAAGGKMLSAFFCVLVALLCLIQPVLMAVSNYSLLDRSDDWALHDQGQDLMGQPMPRDSRVIGLLGETTLIRYFQAVERLRPDILAVAADSEIDRHLAVEESLAAGSPVYLTRTLAGAAERYSLTSLGPLVRVWPKGQAEVLPPQRVLNAPMSPDIDLAGYSAEIVNTRLSPFIRVDLVWQVHTPVSDNLKASVRAIDEHGAVIASSDSEPVRYSYPTWAWIAGETIGDSHDLMLPSDVQSGPARLLVILYHAEDGSEVSRADLGEIRLP